MKLRPYTPEDLPRVLALFRNTVHTVCVKDYTPEQLEAWAPETLDETRWQETLCAHYSLIAEENGQLMGFADGLFRPAVCGRPLPASGRRRTIGRSHGNPRPGAGCPCAESTRFQDGTALF